jgi:8-oxo-dGTP pyrophosphatase MutT (NUDIX family)
MRLPLHDQFCRDSGAAQWPPSQPATKPAEGTGPETNAIPDAAVVLILQDAGESTEFLVIQRAENPRDYWSGHLALPGGRADQTDESLLATAAREVVEEVGIQLSLEHDFVGQLTPLAPSSSRLPLIRVTPFVAVIREPVTLCLSHEVGSAFWASVEQLKDDGPL